ncbi:amidohydrolase family-domain-containing protein [Crepidotus variabilis]|uniref:Amidohydrolase family-domain-containing protein n=1 Tax=Crepidotus variabilis TaxID=179855 RepID=A0A9P6EIH5_9AGAR|nr:amidohydrolase family-domain-containing protein [Crepidotus variabilis]
MPDPDPAMLQDKRDTSVPLTRSSSSGISLNPSLRWLGLGLLPLAFFLADKKTSSQSSLDNYILCTENSVGIYTVDNLNTRTQCILVDGAYIRGSGTLGNLSSQGLASGREVRYLEPGVIVIPGISDSHGHILEYGGTQQLLLQGAKTIQDAVTLVREFILANPDIRDDPSKPVTGGGWDHTIWPGGIWPTAADLEADEIVRGRHVVLQSKDCHALWVSGKALEMSMPFPEEVDGGIIARNSAGQPTGTLLDNAQELLKQPELTESDLMRRFKVAVRDAHRFGLTSIHDAGLNPISLAFFKRQAKLGPLPIRIYGMSFFDETEPYWGNTSRPTVDIEYGRLSSRSVKIFADGALRTGGAALHAPYHDKPSTSGFMRIDPAVLTDFIPKFLRDGWQVNVHAIGDKANKIVIDAFEMSLKGANVTALRPRLEHAQMMTQEDMTRLGRLGVIASIQPAHAISDMWYAETRLGPERIKELYAFRSIIDSGAKIAMGSDFPVEDMNPLAGFYAAITRKSPSGESPHGSAGWFPEQRLTREEALRGISSFISVVHRLRSLQGMTIDPAFASFTENNLGSLEVGKRADFTILSQDIMEVPAEDILKTTVLATIIDGKPVYGKI